MPIILPPAPTSGTIHWEWIQSDGTVRDLTWTASATVFVSRGATGLGSAGSEITDEKNPTGPGSTVRHITTPPKKIQLPITVIASDFGTLATIVKNLRLWFRTGNERQRQPGYLRITRPDGAVRVWQCYYQGDGLSGDLMKTHVRAVTLVVDLYAPDPWPTASANTVVTWSAAALGSPVSQINEGEQDAYPIWKVTGPATQINVANTTTLKNWSLTYSLLAGKYVTVDTRPPEQQVDLPVLDSDGVNRYPALFGGSQVYENWMSAGLNLFTITLLGTSGATSVELRYLPRYLDALP